MNRAQLMQAYNEAGYHSPDDGESDIVVLDEHGRPFDVTRADLSRIRHMVKRADAEDGWNAFVVRPGRTYDEVVAVIETGPERGVGL